MSKTQGKQSGSSKKGGASRTSSSRNSASAFLERVSATIEAHRMIAPRDTVLVAISGGPDSTALLHALVQLRSRLRCRLRACHVHHGLRGTDADADAKQAADLATSLKVPFTRRRADVPAYARTYALSIEAAARVLRYQLLESAADTLRASRIATGHTADDQAETVLLNMIRGAGPQGLAGIPPVRGKVIRPLLDVTHSEVEQYCDFHKLSHRLDRSNLDTAFRRNRIRHEILPALARIQPKVVAGLGRLADILRAENEFMAEQAAHALREIAAQRPGEVGIACGPFGVLPRALQRRVLRAAVARVKGDELDLDLERIDALAALAVSGQTGSVVELPGAVRAELTYGELVIVPAIPQPVAPKTEWTLPVPGEVSIAELGLTISARRSRARRPPPHPTAALVDAERITPPLTVRTRRRGDRFTPFGMKGTVKLQDFFVNAKVPRTERARVPLVLSGDEIIWVVGYRINERFKVRSKTRRTVRLQATRPA
jgi:tRNA(Ile)-lysidine synthase